MNLLIRADATVEIGTGHVMRCFALAQAWQDRGGKATFALAQSVPAIEEKLRSDGFEVVSVAAVPGSPDDAKQTSDLAKRQSASWIVVDGYQFNTEYMPSIKRNSQKVLLVDDLEREDHYSADIVLNQNLGTNGNSYRDRESRTRLLLGPRFAMLRREFKPWRKWTRSINADAKKVLVMMGGSDPGNFTAVTIQALQHIKDVEAKIVIGGANPHLSELERELNQSSSQFELLSNVSNIAELMAWADVAVSAAGTVCWEMCLLRLTAILVDLAPNQQVIARGLQSARAAVYLGSSEDVTAEMIRTELSSLLLSHEQRSALSQAAQALVDGRGADRVVSAMMGDITLRKVTDSDRELLWRWVNDPDVRSASFSSAPISWEEHCEWFRNRMAQPGTFMYIALDANLVPVGQARLHLMDKREAEISVSLSAEQRGKELAAPLIEEATQVAFERGDVDVIHAFIKPANIPSSRAFEAAQFRSLGGTLRSGQDALHYARKRSLS
jgi:UDP-2,4-diacetamido-2,4,6-trideoxy-beta-L-altropyranose hydrolase